MGNSSLGRKRPAIREGRIWRRSTRGKKKKKKEGKEEESNCGQSLDMRVHNAISLFRDICVYIQRENATEQRGVVKG